MNCPECNTAMWLDGFKRGRQAYKCPECHKQLTDPAQQGKAGRPSGTSKGRTCDLCGKPHYAGGLCQMHYRREKRKK